MKLLHLAVALSFMITGTMRAQSGSNGPILSTFSPSVPSQKSTFQRELELDNLNRLSPGQSDYKQELLACLPESQTSLSTFEAADEQRLLTHQETLTQQIRSLFNLIEVNESQPVEEGMDLLSQRERVLDHATLAMLETQLRTVNEELAHYSHQTGRWEAMVMDAEEDPEPVQWLVQAETGMIR